MPQRNRSSKHTSVTSPGDVTPGVGHRNARPIEKTEHEKHPSLQNLVMQGNTIERYCIFDSKEN